MFLGGVVLLLLAAVTFVPLKWVRVKMLPFDNKSEFQVIIDMPDGTPLEHTTRVAQALGQYLGQQSEVINYQIYAGTSGPYNFNGLVRHYFLRNQPNEADIPAPYSPPGILCDAAPFVIRTPAVGLFDTGRCERCFRSARQKLR